MVLPYFNTNYFVSNILERLHPREYAILEAASVIGEQFYIDVLKEIIQPSLCCNLYLGISVLEEAGVIIALADGYYGFISAIVHNHVYGKIPERYESDQFVYISVTLMVYLQ